MKKGVIAATVFTGVLYWVSLPSSTIAIDLDDCKPDGVLAEIRTGIHGEAFWKKQETALRSEVSFQRGAPARTRKVKKVAKELESSAKKTLNEMYAETPQLEPEPPTRAERLRELAEDAERRKTEAFLETLRVRYIGRLERCLSRVGKM